MSILFSTLTIKNITLKNRVVVSPMCQYSSEDGFAGNWHLVHLGSRAVGGAGLIFMEATAVSTEGRITYADNGIWKDEHIEKLKEITTFIHNNGSVAGIQLAHAGRKASCEKPWLGGKQISSGKNAWQPVAPSAIAFGKDDILPQALSPGEIETIIQQFKDAASRALAAGFKVIEIHAAHGYLVHSFFSPLSNNRTDEYGGSFDNRIRLLLQIIETVQETWPADLPLFVRISATDWAEGGWTLEDSIQLAHILKKMGVDVVDASSGGLVRDAKIPAGPGYQVPFAEAIRKQVEILTGAVGIIVEAGQAEEILQERKADLIFMAREHLRDPYFSLHAAKILEENIDWPSQYERAKR